MKETAVAEHSAVHEVTQEDDRGTRRIFTTGNRCGTAPQFESGLRESESVVNGGALEHASAQ
ncbi:hypothetical protein K7G98_38605, partial [Saccharothrix sp. MB29]|nr:hypothetical protein [Saccharothrix sp. MB29]